MNNLTYFIIVTVLIFTSCRKETEKDVKEIDSATEINCYNDEFDAHELGLDCGGEFCEPCEVNSAPCSQPEDRAYLQSGFSYATLTVTSTSIETNSNGVTKFYAYLENSESKYLMFRFPLDGKPDITKTYKASFFSESFEQDEVYVVYSDYGSEDAGFEGSVHVTFENGAYRIESCDYLFYGSPVENWFNISFD